MSLANDKVKKNNDKKWGKGRTIRKVMRGGGGGGKYKKK